MPAIRGSIFLAMITCIAVLAGCGQPPVKLSPQAEKFKKEMLGTMDKLGQELLPSLKAEQTRPGQQPGDICQNAVKKIYQQADRQGRPLPYIIGLLDKNAVVQAYWGPSQKEGGPDELGLLGNDYSKSGELTQVYQDGKVVNTEVYYSSGSYFMVCGPVPRQGSMWGALCLAFTAKVLKEVYGLDVEGFKSINFND